MAQRASCWSITINNPTKEDDVSIAALRRMPWFIEFKSQLEQGEEGTPHIQGMLRTSQQRFGTIKKALPRAHIEIARSAAALQAYVTKEDTRLATREGVSRDIPTLFEYQDRVAFELKEENVLAFVDALDVSEGEAALMAVDAIVSRHVAAGGRGLEFIAINPMWRSSWKKFWRSIIKRNASSSFPAPSQASEAQDGPQGSEGVFEGSGGNADESD